MATEHKITFNPKVKKKKIKRMRKLLNGTIKSSHGKALNENETQEIVDF